MIEAIGSLVNVTAANGNSTVYSTVLDSVAGQLLWLPGEGAVAGQRFLAMQTTLDTGTWDGLVPGGQYRIAVRAWNALGPSAWSAWSPVNVQPPHGYCLSPPIAPGPPRRDAALRPHAGRINLVWDGVLAGPESTGGDDPALGGVAFELWGRPGPAGEWRQLRLLPTYEPNPFNAAQLIPVAPRTGVDTYPETPLGVVWTFRLRLGNRNGFFSPFGPEVELASGNLPDPPRQLASSFVNGTGYTQLTWLPPEHGGYAVITGYEARCVESNSTWVLVANTELSWSSSQPLPVGSVKCEVRTVNAVGRGRTAELSITVL
jgi:hypothetical protein